MSEDTQRQNSKSVRVNAQVTAVITMLEFCGGCIYLVGRILRLPISFGSIYGIILTMILYFVVLPYAFLMNTRYNKSRIIEEGWMNVLKNMIFSYKCNAVVPANNSLSTLKGDGKLNNARTKRDVATISIIPYATEISTSEEIVLNTFNNTINDNNMDSDIDSQQPTCSYSIVDLENNSNGCIEKDKGNKDKTSITNIRENMISDLLSNIDNEYIYIKKLKHFVNIEELHKSGKDMNTWNYDYEQLGVDTLPHFIGCSERKSDMRTTKLQNLLHCRKDNDTYQIYFEQFMEMEENFFENGC